MIDVSTTKIILALQKQTFIKWKTSFNNALLTINRESNRQIQVIAICLIGTFWKLKGHRIKNCSKDFRLMYWLLFVQWGFENSKFYKYSLVLLPPGNFANFERQFLWILCQNSQNIYQLPIFSYLVVNFYLVWCLLCAKLFVNEDK